MDLLAFVLRQELANEKLYPGDVTPDLEYGLVVLGVGEVEGVYGVGPHVFLADQTCGKNQIKSNCALVRIPL